MLIHRKRRPRYGVQAPLTSLIDIVFLLLLYFLLTTKFMVEEGIDIHPPQANASKTQTESEVTVYVDAKGRIYLQKEEVSLHDLFEKLKDAIGKSEDALVVIKADRDVVLNRAVQVMDVAKAAGAGRLSLATEKGF